MGSKAKDLSVETLRGFAIIFMVAGHIIGGSSLDGMKVADNSIWRYFYFTLEYLRMPFFTVISGYVYSLWPVGNAKLSDFFKSKGRRILIPLVAVSTVHFLIQHFVPGTNTKQPLLEIWKIYVMHYEHFWFLQSIFLIFILIGIVDYFKLITSFRNWLILFILAAILRNFVAPFQVDVFSINGFFYLLPFFLLGCGIERFQKIFTGNVMIRSVISVFAIAFLLQQYNWFNGKSLNFYEENALSLVVACSGIIFFFHVRKNIPLMSKLGYYAYGIYLFHVLGTAGSRIILMKIGLNIPVLVFTAGLVFGLGIPILLEMICIKSRVLRKLFFGMK